MLSSDIFWGVVHATYRRILAQNDIDQETRIALRAYLDLTNPRGVHIGDGTLIETGASVLAHDPAGHFHTQTHIGRNCFIGTRAIIMAGVTIGDQSIILPGSIVSTNVPSGSAVAGSPARVIRSGIRTGKYGILLDADASALSSEPKATSLKPGKAY